VYLQGLSTDTILSNPAELLGLMMAKLEWLNRCLVKDGKTGGLYDFFGSTY
jgi:hypothetical protein